VAPSTQLTCSFSLSERSYPGTVVPPLR
jgi:hypothetical protein